MGRKKSRVKSKGSSSSGVGAIIGVIVILAAIGGIGGSKSGDTDRSVTTPAVTTTKPNVTRKAPVTQHTTVTTTTQAPETEPPVPKVTEPKVYWLNKNSGIYHKAGCRTIKDGTTEDYWESSTDIEWLRSNYKSCGACNPY